MQVETQGRRIVVPRVAENSDVAWFHFSDLCDKPLGAADYLALGQAFHTIFVADIPRLTMQERDQVRRFITLIDTLYESHAKLICAADLDPISLFHVTEEERKTSVADEIFAWDRTVSRLMEMQSAAYLSAASRALSADQFLGQYKLKSLSDQDTGVVLPANRHQTHKISRQETQIWSTSPLAIPTIGNLAKCRSILERGPVASALKKT